MSATPTPLLSCRDVEKSFGGVQALRGASMEVGTGTVHGLVGHNGAGKSTLIRIVAGLIGAGEGTVTFGGEELKLGDHRAALAAGIVSVPQELTILPGISLAGNISVGHEPHKGPFVRRRAMRARARDVLALLGASIPEGMPIEDLPASQQRIVMIATALSRPCRLLILDEPTAALDKAEAEPLMQIVERLPTQGVTVLYVSHRLDEVVRLCDRITIMRDGRERETADRGTIGTAGLVELMVGELEAAPVRRANTAGPDAVAGAAPSVDVRGLTAGVLRGVDFRAWGGRVTGLTGLVGSGVAELLEVICGARRPEAGDVSIGGAALSARSPADALAAGVGYIAGSRAVAGVLALTVRENVLLSSLPQSARGGFVRRAPERARAGGFVTSLGLAERLEDPLWHLSGGNQQKAIVARLLAADAQVLVLDDPTAGVDVRARAELHALLRRVAEQGRTVIVCSSEPEELVELADIVHVLAGGRITRTFESNELSVEALVDAAARSGHEA